MITNTIKLIKYLKDDFDDYYTLVSDDQVMRYVSGKGLSVQQAKRKFTSNLEVNQLAAQIGYFKVYNHHSEFIGDCKLEPNKYDSSKLEIGYLLKEAFWGKGYATMICEQLIAVATQLYPEKDIIGVIDPKHIVSRKVLEKFGFKSYFLGVEDGLPTEKLILMNSNSNR